MDKSPTEQRQVAQLHIYGQPLWHSDAFIVGNELGLRLIVSFADPEQKHHGGIYQAGNWIYAGKTTPQVMVMYQGKVRHKRSVGSVLGTTKGLAYTKGYWKHKYLFPLDEAMRQKVEKLRQPYPKRATEA